MPSFPERQFSGESLDSIPARLQSVSNHCQVFGAARGRRKGDELPKSAAALRMIRFCASAEQTQAQTPDAARRRLQLQREHKDPGARDTNALTCGEAARFSVTNEALFLEFIRRRARGEFLTSLGESRSSTAPAVSLGHATSERATVQASVRPRRQLLSFTHERRAQTRSTGGPFSAGSELGSKAGNGREELRCGRMFGGVAPLLLWRSSACAPTQINGCVYTEQGGGSGNGAGDKEGHAWMWRGGEGSPSSCSSSSCKNE